MLIPSITVQPQVISECSTYHTTKQVKVRDYLWK